MRLDVRLFLERLWNRHAVQHARLRNRRQSHMLTAASVRYLEALEPRILLSAANDLIGVTALRADPTFAGIDGSGVSVVVIDTGVDVTHPLIAGNYVFDATSGGPVGQDFAFGGSNPVPVDLHGTHVAGIIGATDPDISVAPGVNLIGLQVFQAPAPGEDGQPRAYDNAIEAALQWSIEHREEYNIVAVNMSLGGGEYLFPVDAASDPFADEISLLEDLGVAVVSSAGNNFDVYSHLARLGLSPTYELNTVGSPGILSTFNVGAVYEGDPDDPAVEAGLIPKRNENGSIP